jgi:HD-like signal output (HDOD) protein
MTPSFDLGRIALLCRRSVGFVSFPQTAARVLEIIDRGDGSIRELERAISIDPTLAANIMRLSRSSAMNVGGSTECCSLSNAIAKIGFSAVRSLALSLAVREHMSSSHNSRHFDTSAYSRHSVAVGLLARYVFVRRQQSRPFTSNWSADELFAMGVLHDVGRPVLARAMPQHFDRAAAHAKRTGFHFRDAFFELFGTSLSDVGATATDAWKLPSIFTAAVRCVHEPWEFEEDFTSACCLSYANALAKGLGFGADPSEGAAHPHEAVGSDVLNEVQLPEEELQALGEVLSRHVAVFIETPG